MTELATSTRGDRVAYDRYGPADGGPTAVLVAGAGSLRGDEAIADHGPAGRRRRV